MSVESGGLILVTGATGGHGNTGRHLVRRLREAQHPVRVLARRHNERTERLAELGAEVVIGDLHDRTSLTSALADVDLTYFTYPVAAGVISAGANFAEAVRETERQIRTVVMSMGPAHPKHPSRLGREQWLAEQVIQRAGLDVLILRVTALFHQNLQILHSKSISRYGAFRNSFGSGRVCWINGHDAAEMALAALLHPERFTGPVCYLSGPESFDHFEIASQFSELLDRPVRFEPTTAQDWRAELMEMAAVDPTSVINNTMAQHISSIGAAISTNGATMEAAPEAFRRLTDREPTMLRDFLAANIDCFRPQPH